MTEKSSRATLVDVAREASVSLKTASRALNNERGIAPPTAKRVRAAMTKLGYRPNELARGLKGRRSDAIGMIVPNLADPFIASSVQAVQEVAGRYGHVVILMNSRGDEAAERAEVETLIRRQVDGLIIAPADGRESTVSPFVSANIPVVAFDRPMQDSNIDCVTVTNRDAARDATEHLLSHGYNHILAIGARPHLHTCAERLAGYASTMKRAHLESTTFLVEHESELTPNAIKELVADRGKLDAIFSLNGVMTMLLLRALRFLRGKVSTNVPLISFDDFALAEVLTPSLTVVRQPSAEMGRQAAEMLFARIRGGMEGQGQHVVLPTTFQIRESCGCTEQSSAETASTAVPFRVFAP